ncbi:MAG: hypothetical protein OP8BY_2205 [Candidatus Saccharicenans subterraneus]|uniref:Uncharacterized protein n=1 Tax=Candidatus Saccharicenans subterraneus TaxID=2508984 RepID=A0A3E2BME9_9BACT|nr:MAG: hypothetical protein OP8BY_2205 [Candidatus Saccharicenans subterraneum]
MIRKFIALFTGPTPVLRQRYWPRGRELFLGLDLFMIF